MLMDWLVGQRQNEVRDAENLRPLESQLEWISCMQLMTIWLRGIVIPQETSYKCCVSEDCALNGNAWGMSLPVMTDI